MKAYLFVFILSIFALLPILGTKFVQIWNIENIVQILVFNFFENS